MYKQFYELHLYFLNFLYILPNSNYFKNCFFQLFFVVTPSGYTEVTLGETRPLVFPLKEEGWRRENIL